LSALVELLGGLTARTRREEGQGLAEYALILALIAMVAIVGLLFMGSALSDQLTTIGNAVSSAGP
jgi:Flp pilus assembly pilin Flp